MPNCKLGTLASRLRLDHTPNHRALDDALAEAYDQGGYEAGTTIFAPQTEAIVTEAAVEALAEVVG